MVLFPDYPITKYDQNGIIDIPNIKLLILNFSPSAFGFTGVTLFLIISGFLIHLGYLKNKEIFNASTFFSKRFWRIFPPYWFALLTFTIILNRHDFSNINFRDLIFHFFTIHNLFDSTFFSINASFWSLALEVQLYLLYPFFLFLRNKIGIKTTFKLILALSIAVLVLGIFFNDLINKVSYINSVFELWFIWAAGAYFAEAFFNKKRVFKKGALIISLISFLILFAAKSFLYANYLLQYIATFSWIAFIDWILHNEKVDLKGVLSRWIVKIGICSYSIYLFHQPLLYLIFNFYDKHFRAHFNHPILILIPAFVGIFAMCYFLYLTIERTAISIGANLREKKSNKIQQLL
ncbi:acyltransferase family protein [Mucilaginibacter rubeus]|uniref:Acyltransferase n=1 Tax=Mucilaginibacter rubeus TaxID=2027860 RepID=A0A5C1I3K7_9SPHI|nr:acyltransferase [Mucilaginibacter rubeus]QEM12495.1 acyltransferase [Mucilaginibacter rubeus]